MLKTAKYSRLLFSVIALVITLSGSGCQRLRFWHREPEKPAPPASQAEPVYLTLPGAVVEHVNDEDGYVILECTILPSPDEEAKVYRNGNAVGLLRISELRKGPFVVADIVLGKIKEGHEVQFKCVINSNLKEKLP